MKKILIYASMTLILSTWTIAAIAAWDVYVQPHGPFLGTLRGLQIEPGDILIKIFVYGT